VNKRAITWLLAALMALSAGAAVPVARARTGGASSAIVWIAQERSEQRVLVRANRVTRYEAPVVPPNSEPPAKARQFAASLYQRPPPFLR
jgi:hypothetical protein